MEKDKEYCHKLWQFEHNDHLRDFESCCDHMLRIQGAVECFASNNRGRLVEKIANNIKYLKARIKKVSEDTPNVILFEEDLPF